MRQSIRIFSQVVVALVLFELLGILLGNESFYFDQRYLFVGKDIYRPIDDRFWTYQPNREVRKGATYAFFPGNVWVEYECVFETNELGFPATSSDTQEGREIDLLILGDSMVEAEGGCQWISDQGFDGRNVFNGGLRGTGVASSELALNFVERHKLVKNIAIVVNFDDFYRTPSTRWHTESKSCLVDGRCDLDDYEWVYSTTQEMIDKTPGRLDFRVPSAIDRLKGWLHFHSSSYRMFAKLAGILLNDGRKPDANTFEMNYQAMRSMLSRYPESKVFYVNMRTQTGIFGVDPYQDQLLKSRVADDDLGERFAICTLDNSDFMYIDGHPNKRGYNKIAQCIKSRLGW